jgi:hypothetical protein
MSYDLEDRLQSYGRALDEAADQRAASLDELEVRALPTVTPMRTAHRRPVLLAAAVVAALAIGAAAVIVGSRSGGERTSVSVVTQPPTTPTVPSTTAVAPSTTTSGSTVTTATPSAATNLSEFFTDASRLDGQLNALASAINPLVAAGTTHLPVSIDAAKHAADPTVAAAAIPAGLSPDLEHAVLLVYSELVSRWSSTCTSTGDNPSQPFHDCFTQGAAAAARFQADLAAAKALAESQPPIVGQAPDSRAAADLALQISHIDLGNEGCGGLGGYLATELPPIVWYAHPLGTGLAAVMGKIGPSGFYAKYTPGQGWFARELVC